MIVLKIEIISSTMIIFLELAFTISLNLEH